VTAPERQRGRAVTGVLGSAALIAAVTVLARLVGFGRLYVFSQTVGDSCLGSAYQTANLVPNIVFEVVAGGALAGVLVPVLTGPLSRGDRDRASRTASAALTWSVLGLAAVAGLLALVTGPVGRLLVGGRTAAGCAGIGGVTTTLLLVFLPQIPLYAIAVVLAGALQAQRRFLAPALAPLLSSLVVAAGYVGYRVLAPADAANRLDRIPDSALAVLAGGTTAGVLVLAAAHLPALRSAIRWRPTLRFPVEDGQAVRALALAGIAALLAQQATMLAVAALANHLGGPGVVNLWSYAWAMFLLPYAVLAVPVATSAFPGLAEAAAQGSGQLAAATARAVRLVLPASAVGAALLAGTALPVAWVLVLGPAGSGHPDDLAGGLVAFAPGLLGYGLLAVLSRALYAAGAGRAAATGTATGWLVALLADLVLMPLAGRERVVTALGLGNSIGMTVAGLVLLRALSAVTGPAAHRGMGRATGVAVAAGVAGAAAGWLLVVAVHADGIPANLAAGTAAALAALIVAAIVIALLDRRALTAALALLRRDGRARDGRARDGRAR
jgi:putative peptidoglycan lipid II flippase